MKHTLSIGPAQPGWALVLLATLGFSALIGLAALEPAVAPGQPALSAAPQPSDFDAALRLVEPGVFPVSSTHFERSNEPAIEVDPANAHGG